nr:MAG TPA: hypothetical protein [Caudoviricetes sp.]
MFSESRSPRQCGLVLIVLAGRLGRLLCFRIIRL